ncbi:hypothetical protein PG291_10040 [Riemerella anatipestifer]|nr:hypothetical protein [Riemerella anatipestifer]
MINKSKIISCLLSVMLMTTFTSYSNAQTTKQIAGEYENELYIYEDGTFFAGGMHSFVLGTIEFEGDFIKLIKHRPKHKFALYGRKENSRVYGNTIMFQGFEYNGLVNFSEKNNPPTMMQRVFNENANCFDWPFFYDNSEDCKTIYFTDESDKQLYKFELPEDYRDFVAFRFNFEDDPNLNEPIIAKVSKDFNSISFYDSNEKLMKKPLTQEALETKEMVFSMYERVYPEGKYYYCNPAYNMFEEEGIDINQYEEFGYKGEGKFHLKGSEAYPEGERFENDYHDNTIIYRYEKIVPEIVEKTKYSIRETSIFECKNTQVDVVK